MTFSLPDELKKLHELRSIGALSGEDYELAKKKVLGSKSHGLQGEVSAANPSPSIHPKLEDEDPKSGGYKVAELNDNKEEESSSVSAAIPSKEEASDRFCGLEPFWFYARLAVFSFWFLGGHVVGVVCAMTGSFTLAHVHGGYCWRVFWPLSVEIYRTRHGVLL